MKKLCLVLLLLFCFGMEHKEANGEELEKIYLEGGYKQTYEALKEAEDFFKLDISLPTRIPSIAFTHNFGRFTTLGNPQLEITYLNENSGEVHYKILVTSLKYKQEFTADQNVQRMKLNDGSEAVYVITENFDLLVFEKYGLQYTLMVDKIHLDKFTKEALSKIANSINK
ncbi:DUF4367 domain-containing protein [Viridibacillus sp. YIM B01967]|uniref:DUF4367 domain-containing protein n=1 Tax=Viridibacillus soli TaxID=2798301 RepID=A0ABS1H456_9BACL|nr:DUF4367 domain-containing protein [Viridibacillus soli]MBK3493932.1 DUF4367 domain-containing protein [Viridibacillus soli]